MNKKTILIFCVGTIIGGLIGFNFKNPRETLPIETKLTSQGRKAIIQMEQDLNNLNYANVQMLQTQIIQHLVSADIDETAVDFYAKALTSESATIQNQASEIIIDRLKQMPLTDRETYRYYLLKNKDFIKYQTVVLPLLIQADLTDTGNRPRDRIFRKTRASLNEHLEKN